MQIIYDEETQTIIDVAEKLIKERTESLVKKINDKWAASIIKPSPKEYYEAEKSIREDPALAMLQKALCGVMATAMPSYSFEIEREE